MLCLKSESENMLLKKSIKKSRNFLHKSLQSLRSFLFGKYQNLPKTLILNPLSCTNGLSNSQNFDQIISSECLDSPIPITTKIDTEKLTSEPESKLELALCDERREEGSFRETSGSRSFKLAQRMKVLEMMNGGDAAHGLDVEEALHYYSRLTCPLYVDIVDKFFMDMYKDYYYPQLSISLGSVSQRLSSSRRFGSSRRLGSGRRVGAVLC